MTFDRKKRAKLVNKQDAIPQNVGAYLSREVVCFSVYIYLLNDLMCRRPLFERINLRELAL